MKNESSELTKLLCSIVHYDYSIRNTLLRLLSSNDDQPLLKEHGIDTIEILKHCLYSKQKQWKPTILIVFTLLAIIILFIIISVNSSGYSPVYSLTIIITILIGIFINIIMSAFNIKSKLTFARKFSKDTQLVDIPLSDKNKILLEKKKALLLEKVIIYDDFNPFMGAGIKVDGWSFTIDLTKENEKLSQHENLEFSEAELLEFIEEDLSRINFTSSDIFVISESSIEQYDVDIKKDIVENLLTNCDRLIDEFNFYKKFEIFNFYNFEGITGYITVNKDDFLLYVEVNIYYLPSILNSFNKPINLLSKKELKFGDYINLAGKNRDINFRTNNADKNDKKNYNKRIKGILGNLSLDESLKRNKLKRLSREPYPAFKSVMLRDSIDLFFDNHLQYTKYRILIQKLEKTLLHSIEVFLRERGIDTTEFSNRKTTILNQGIFVEDGNLSIDNLAIGKGAKVSNKTK